MTRRPSTWAASTPLAAGTTTPSNPPLAAAIATVRMPGVVSSSPFRETSPAKANERSRSLGICRVAASTLITSGRSSPGPSFRTLAGARFTTTRRSGHSSLAPSTAGRTRSRASWTPAPGSPVTMRAGRPRPTCASTVTRCPPTPSTATPRTRPYMSAGRYPRPPTERGSRGRRDSIRRVPEPLDHPEPELIDFRDAERSRAALERLGERTWAEALDWLYGPAADRATAPDLYPELRQAFFGESGAPGRAPAGGRTSDDVLAEFRERLVPFAYAAQHPGSYSYFTPPGLPMSIAGETLAQWLNQGIDVWLSGMAAPFVEEEVIRWLCDLCGYGDDAWGVLTSGGVMANVMALTVARDVHLAKVLGGLPRGA